MSKVQILPLLLVLALILAGCQPIDYSPLEPPALDAATRAEIIGNWHQFSETPVQIYEPGQDNTYADLFYYGTYNGYIVFMYLGSARAAVVSELTIGDYTFHWHTSFGLDTLKDGKYSNLDYEYALGNFSDQDILQCLRVHEWYRSTP